MQILPLFFSGVIEIPTTIRSEFSFAQFRERLQNYAYKLACDAISDPEQHGRIRIIMTGRRMNEIETKEFTIRFYAAHASFQKNKVAHQDEYTYTVADWGFDVEDKEYTTSNHRSKISYFGSDVTKWNPKTEESDLDQKRTKEVEQAVFNFINMLMDGVKVEPRFSLQHKVSKD